MKLRKYLSLITVLAVILSFLNTNAHALTNPWHYYHWKGKMPSIANTCNDPSAPAVKNADYWEQSLSPLGALKDNSTGLLYSLNFYGWGKNFYTYFASPIGGCYAHFFNKFENISRSKKTAQVTSWYYFECPRAKCFYKYYGNLKY